MELCDRVTVLRHGRSVGTEEIGNLDEMTIARMMVGRDVVLAIDKDEPKPHDRIVEVKDLVYVDGEGRRVLDGVSFSIRAGEVVGIAGVEGNGQSELSDIISGMLPVLGGSVRISGEEIKDKSIRDVRNLGVSHISEDRLKYGCALELSVKENILSSRLNKKEFRKGLFLDHKRANEFVDQCIEEYEILCYDRTEPVKMLSGGNIQKVIVAREFSGEARLILANQPTRGIDVGTTEMIRKTIIKKVREENIGALLVSSDLNEVLEVSDRLLVMRKGKIVACFKRASDVPEELLGEYMLGVRTMTPDEMGEEL